ncbi:AbgT family transporter [Alteriqipengyuania flavescens]|uniref:AbgT family transporter n=1 Tax=Alteriqipengyuania flavescens TaxID=3053610 RepID=UPI0025B389A5|nr:AbgT family transporter [Alteriqipengyuania flavescens]WJY18985.1 AbgT family transporter [Alteriqipengyuania flavescens]WJY24926.1 AbgT family transporter [Alteriqipengyuania flavescens]
MTVIFLPVIWYVTDRMIEPRLGRWDPAKAGNAAADEQTDRALTDGERKGLRRAGLAVLGVVALWLVFNFGPGTPLMVYFPLILIFCQRWQKDFGLGSLAATMLPIPSA